MQLAIPSLFEAWIGGYVGPSYKISLTKDGTLVYEVFGEGYALHSRRELQPTPGQWRSFLRQLDETGIWAWEDDYNPDDVAESEFDTTWSVSLAFGTRSITSHGREQHPPGFVEYLRAVRTLLNGHHFA